MFQEIRGFFETGSIYQWQNETFIRLIPRVDALKRVVDYWSIALCNV